MVAVTGLPYPVSIATGALDQLGDVVHAVAPGNRAMAFVDTEVNALHGERVADLLSPLGCRVVGTAMDEKHKTRATWAKLTDMLLENGFGRDTTLVALGGGVVGDVIGFVAATYMRGVPFVQVPTTLLAMVDACVGGKTGVDTRMGKNLVGAFHQPAAVVIDPDFLDTLPDEHFRAGFAEIIKHGVVADAGYFAQAHSYLATHGSRRDGQELAGIIARSVEIKAEIVVHDERESGRRKVLNFGHTIGHAVEAATHFEMLHGEAVSIGLVTEARIAERLGVADPGTAAEIERACATIGLPTGVPTGIAPEQVLRFTRSDKKARGGHAEYALPKRIGEMAAEDRGWSIPVDDTVVLEVLACSR